MKHSDVPRAGLYRLSQERDMDTQSIVLDENGKHVYPHTLFSIGISAEPFDAVIGHVVLVHATMGESRFEFRFTAENARSVARMFLDAADNADAANR
jgi:hypothetical protein